MSENISYTNRKGSTFHLCEVRDQAGKVRYVLSRDVRGKPLAAIPRGYEIRESVNGQVSLRKIAASPISDDELQQVRAELARHGHLAKCKVEVKAKTIVVHEAHGGAEELADALPYLGPLRADAKERLDRLIRYEAVMRFTLLDAEARTFRVERMCYRGRMEGWLDLHEPGPIGDLARRYLRHIGRESFYDLSL